MADGIGLQAGYALAYVMVILGIAGSIVPVLPGPILIWAGAFIWAWTDGFVRMGAATLTLLGLLAVAAWGSDLILTTVVSRRAGASWWSLLGAIVGGLVGAALLTAVPLLGTILGALLGALGGMWLVEYLLKGDWQAATSAVQAYLGSVIAATVVEMAIALVMVAIFAYQAFL